jgi:DNA-binding transcriptional LysR family regulator
MHSLSLIDLGGLLTDFHHARPAVQLIPRSAQGGSSELVAEVAEGRLDLAFVALPSGYPKDLEVRALASEEMVLLCPPEEAPEERRAVSLHDLAGRPFIDFPPGWGVRLATDELFRLHGVHREIAVEVSDVPNIVDLVKAGFGFAFLAPSMVAVPREAVIRRVTEGPRLTISLVISRTRPLSAAARAFVEMVTARYP